MPPTSTSLREYGIPTSASEPFSLFQHDTDLKQHAAYQAAKAGNERAAFILLTDVTNMGGTLAELANHIQRQGGTVAAIIVLVNAGRLKHLAPDKTIIGKLERIYPDEITKLFHIHPRALTANEAQYLIGFKTADEIRNRRTKATEEIHRRLRSKGIELTAGDDG
jgi:hypothetical protein